MRIIQFLISTIIKTYKVLIALLELVKYAIIILIWYLLISNFEVIVSMLKGHL